MTNNDHHDFAALALDVQRALDKYKAQQHEQHQDDAMYAINWEPLHNSDVPADEHDGWMFMENSPPASDFYHNAPEPLTTYKHGITRCPLHLNAAGFAFRRVWVDGQNYWVGPQSAHAELATPRECMHANPTGGRSTRHMHSHYDQLAELDAAPATRYDQDYQRQRNQRLREAGYTVVSSD